MDILYYIRDHLVGTHYFIYAFVLSIFMFAMMGYLFKQKYGKLDVILNSSQKSGSALKTDNKKPKAKKNDAQSKTVLKEQQANLDKKNYGITDNKGATKTVTVQAQPATQTQTVAQTGQTTQTVATQTATQQAATAQLQTPVASPQVQKNTVTPSSIPEVK